MHSDAAPVRTQIAVESSRSVVAQKATEISLREAIQIALRRYPGRVLRAAPVERGERTVYEIRLIEDDGRTVRTARIDARTGRFLTDS